MAHPPLNNLHLYDIKPPNTPSHPLMEKISEVNYPDPFVHFDIDPQNGECLVTVMPSPC